MGHISFWLMLMICIYWEMTDTIKKNTETLIVAISSPECRSKSGYKNRKQIV
jgi:hypothetical protein